VCCVLTQLSAPSSRRADEYSQRGKATRPPRSNSPPARGRLRRGSRGRVPAHALVMAKHSFAMGNEVVASHRLVGLAWLNTPVVPHGDAFRGPREPLSPAPRPARHPPLAWPVCSNGVPRSWFLKRDTVDLRVVLLSGDTYSTYRGSSLRRRRNRAKDCYLDVISHRNCVWRT
jgi:hypothetical protein